MGWTFQMKFWFADGGDKSSTREKSSAKVSVNASHSIASQQIKRRRFAGGHDGVCQLKGEECRPNLGSIELPEKVWIIRKGFLDALYRAWEVLLGQRTDLKGHFGTNGRGSRVGLRVSLRLCGYLFLDDIESIEVIERRPSC
jgi:hypothetical protein